MLRDVYHKEHESHEREFLGISRGRFVYIDVLSICFLLPCEQSPPSQGRFPFYRVSFDCVA